MAARINGILLLLLIASATEVLGLTLTKFSVPEHHMVTNDDSNELDLHCEHTTVPEDKEYVIKWYFNDSTTIFQWIPDKSGPQAFTDQFKQHIILPKTPQEPLKIKNPNHTFSGKYTCTLSSYNNVESKNGAVQVVDASKSTVKLTHKITDDSIDVECVSMDSYPKPTLRFIVGSETLATPVSHRLRDDGHYDASLKRLVKKEEIKTKGTKYGCELIVGTEKFNVSMTDLRDLNESNGCNGLLSLNAILTLVLSTILANLIDQI